MNRREFLKRCGLAGLTALSPRSVLATQPFRRRRPSDSDWPSPSAWKRLNDQVDGNLVPVEFPLDACIKDTNSVACQDLAANIKNPGMARVGGNNVLGISMVSHGLSTEEARRIWKPFLDWIGLSPGLYIIEPGMILGSMPARHWWDVEWKKQQHQDFFIHDSRPGASPNNVWWPGDAAQVGWTIYGFESLWLPASLLDDHSGERLANALFDGSRYNLIEVQFDKGLGGAPSDAIESARDTATNPAVLDAFALAIIANGQVGYRYPGVRGLEPDVVAGRKSREQVHRSMNELRALARNGGSYVSESNFFEEDWQHSYWGPNYARLASVKEKYDPSGLFFVHNGVGSEKWSADGFTKV